MREKLNSNPLVQVAIVGVLLVATGFFVMSSMGRGGQEESESSTATSSTTTTAATSGAATSGAATSGVAASSAAAPGVALSLVNGASDAPSPPRPVVDAWKANKTLVLLFVHNGGIDDHLVADAVRRIRSLPGAAVFVVPARKISRYAAITEGVGLERVPALVVVRPKHLGQSMPTASLSYGFQSSENIVQAVVDAGYKGRTLHYHP